MGTDYPFSCVHNMSQRAAHIQSFVIYFFPLLSGSQADAIITKIDATCDQVKADEPRILIAADTVCDLYFSY